MTLPDLLLMPLYLLAFLVPGVWLVMWRAARRKPRINALTWTARFVGVVALVIVSYVLAVGNAFLSYLVPREIAQIEFRGVIVALGLLALHFFRLYRSGRFADDFVDPLESFAAWFAAYRQTLSIEEIESELERRRLSKELLG